MTAGPVIPEGFRIGHWTDPVARTGCTVILCPPSTVGGCDVRGSSPGSRELALLAADKTMQEVHAVLLTGGSAFGLAAADGVMRYLEEHGIGYQTPWARVPIVPAVVVFDLNNGSSTVRPTADSGYAAASAATGRDIPEGSVGAGTGVTVGKWAGMEWSSKGGFALASVERNGVTLAAAAVVNAVGDVLNARGEIIAGARSPDGRWRAEVDPFRTFRRGNVSGGTNTTLVALFCDARLSKVEAIRVAQRGHDGMARAVTPVHTSFDGDTVFCLASGTISTEVDVVAEAGAEAVAQAIRRAVLLAQGG
ncbi:MAG: P1 family peptidase [Bacteroidota bacterium]